MKDNKVEQSDLIGKIKHFPIEIVQKMVDYQVAQGNKADVTVFQENPSSYKPFGGFSWKDTEEPEFFWVNVIINYDFEVFFNKYPKANAGLSTLHTKFTRYNNLSKGQLCQMRNQIGWIRNNTVLEYYLDRQLEDVQDILDTLINQWSLNQDIINKRYGKKDNH